MRKKCDVQAAKADLCENLKLNSNDDPGSKLQQQQQRGGKISICCLTFIYISQKSIFVTKICYQALKNIGWDPGYAKNLSRISNTVEILCTFPCMSDIKCENPTLYRKFYIYHSQK